MARLGRKKVKLAWIANNSARRNTFRQRMKGLLKKMNELRILCDVEGCAIVYGPINPNPDVSPSIPDAIRVLLQFSSLPKEEQRKRMFNQEKFLEQRISKMKEKIKQKQRENHRFEITELMNQIMRGKRLQGVPNEDLSDIIGLLEEKMDAIQKRMGNLKMIAIWPPQSRLVGNKMPLPIHMQTQMSLPMQTQMQMPTMLSVPQLIPMGNKMPIPVQMNTQMSIPEMMQMSMPTHIKLQMPSMLSVPQMIPAGNEIPMQMQTMPIQTQMHMPTMTTVPQWIPACNEMLMSMQMQTQTSMPTQMWMQTELGFAGGNEADMTTRLHVIEEDIPSLFNDAMNPPHGGSHYVGDDLVMCYGDNA